MHMFLYLYIYNSIVIILISKKIYCIFLFLQYQIIHLHINIYSNFYFISNSYSIYKNYLINIILFKNFLQKSNQVLFRNK